MKRFLTGLFLGLLGANLSAQTLYWNTNGSPASLTSTNWSTSASGPFTSAWSNSSTIEFGTDSAITNVTNTPVGNIIVDPGVTVTWTAAGTFSTGGNVRTIDVGKEGTLVWNGQNISTSGGTGFIKNGLGTWNIGSQGNTYTGGFTLNAGTVLVGGVNALGAGAMTINGGTIAPDSGTARDFSSKFTSLTIGGDFQLGDAAHYSSGTGSLTFGAASLGDAVRTITIGGTGTYTFNGALSGSSGNGLTITSTSSGSLVLSGANTYAGPTTINSGSVTLSGASGSLALSSSAILLHGGTFTIDNTGASSNNNDRIFDTQAIALSGGNLVYKGSNQTSTNSSEIIGAITQSGGNDSITLTFGSTNTATLTAASFTHTPGNAATLINGVNLGKDSTSTASVSRFILTEAPTLIGTTNALTTGINSSSKDTKIVPFLVGEATTTTGGLGTASGTANTFLTYNPTTGLRPLNPTDEFTANTFVTDHNTRITSGTTASSSVAINSLIVVSNSSSAVSLTNGSTLTITSGALLFTGNGTITTSSAGSLSFGSTEGMISVNNGGNATIAASITGNGGVTKSGAGTLTLSAANVYTGGTSIASGTLALVGGNDRLKPNEAISISGGTLDLGTTNQSASGVILSSGSVTGTGSLNGSSYAFFGGTISASLGGTGAMTVAGSATLSGDNSAFSGAVAINGGTLTAAHEKALGTGTTTVNSGGTLAIADGIGLVTSAKVALNHGTLLGGSGSNFAGTLSGSGTLDSLTLTSEAIIEWSLNDLSIAPTSVNQYSLAGQLALGGAAVQIAGISPSADPFWSSNRSWVLVSKGSGTITGTLAPLSNTGWNSYGTFSTGTNGNGDLTLDWTAAGAPIPEPSTYALLIGGTALVWVAVRRRRVVAPRS